MRQHPALVLALVLLFPAAVASLEATDAVWITLGDDAFATIVEELEVDLGTTAPIAHAGAHGVVLTRVSARHLEQISQLLHDTHRRCPGFLRHRDRAAGMRALAAAGESLEGLANYTIDQAPTVQALEPLLDKPTIQQTIEDLSTDFPNRYHEHPSGTAASEWIRDLWQGYATGRSDVTVDLVSHSGVNQPSVVLTIAGSTLADEVVILGGHMDSIASGSGNPTFSAPGADDNASGIAVLSDVVRVALAEGFRPQRTVSFMAYAAEEIGLVGSQDLAQQYAAASVDVYAVLQLDMTDFNGSTADIGVLSDHTDGELTGFVIDLIEAYQPELVWTPTQCGYGCSDHASWTAAGYRAAMPFEAVFGQHNPSIHSTGDTLANLGNSVDHAFKFARIAVAFLVEAAKPIVTEIFADGFESGDVSAWSETDP